MRDVCLSSIIPQKLHSESICIIRILILGAVASMLFVPVSAYEENVSFDGDSSFNLINCSRIVWHIDPSTGHLSPPSLRSGPIQSGGASCVAKMIEGPARINFWWRADPDIPQLGTLLFMVDNKTILQCTSSDWSPVDYAVPSGNHRLSWEYRKLRSYPEYAGAGWIDDLKVVSIWGPRPSSEVKSTNLISNDTIGTFKQDLSRFEFNISIVEKKMSGLEGNITGINATIKVINGRFEDTNLSEIEYDVLELVENISGINKTIEKINDTIGQIANVPYDRNVSIDLSWISDNVVFVSDKESDLTDIILKNKDKILILDDGIYHIDGLQITTDNVTIRSLRKWGAVIDANDAREGVLLDTVKNVRIESLIIMNCTNGIHVENSTDCYIIDNIFTDFKEIGVFVKNSSNSSFILNIVKPLENFKKIGIQLNKTSDNNIFLFNKIYIDEKDNRSRLYEIDQFCRDNVLYVSDAGRIEEGRVTCGINNSTRFDCDGVFRPRNMWEFLRRELG